MTSALPNEEDINEAYESSWKFLNVAEF